MTDDLTEYKPETLEPELRWKGEGPPPKYWFATNSKGEKVQVYRSYADYCMD